MAPFPQSAEKMQKKHQEQPPEKSLFCEACYFPPC